MFEILNKLQSHINLKDIQNTNDSKSQSWAILTESSKVNKEKKNNRDSEDEKTKQNFVDLEEIGKVCTSGNE